MPVRSKFVQVGDRPLAIRKLPLGPIRNDPEAFAFLQKSERKGEITVRQTAMTVFASIDQKTTPISEADFYALVDDMDCDTGTDALTEAFVVAMQGAEASNGAGEAQADPGKGSSLEPGSAASTV
jgi:hypothetical protein